VPSLNLGVVAHVDAGKTSLTERLLHAAGVLDAPGSVDAGSTQTDTMALERRRGITIRSAVATFTVGDVLVNLLDTPGHADFVAEVERALAVLDGAVLVVSAVEGVQAQTVVLFRVLRRLGIPTLVFVNKVDRAGADPERVVERVAARLSPSVVALQRVERPGSPDAAVVPRDPRDPGWQDELTEVLAGVDDEVLTAYAEDRPLGPEPLLRRFEARARAGEVHPVLFGSAITGAGVPELLASLPRLLPVGEPDPDATPSGLVFKVERGPAREKRTYLLVRSGTVRVRDRLVLGPEDGPARRAERVTGIEAFAPGGTTTAGSLAAGRIGRVRGLERAQVGDLLGPTAGRRASTPPFIRPSLESLVEPEQPAPRGRLHAALVELAEQDPLIEVRQDDARHEISVALYGEVQKEVLAALLTEEYGVVARFGDSTVLCVEQVTGTGAAVQRVGDPGNPFLATVGLRVGPAPVGAGVRFDLAVERGAMPAAFFTAVEEAVRRTLPCGPHGWVVPDCVVTMTHSHYLPRQSHAHATFEKAMSSTAADFRHLTPLVLMTALTRAGTVVCEPLHRYVLEGPRDTQGALLALLAGADAVPLGTGYDGDVVVLSGEVPAAAVHALRLRLPGVSRGEGVLTTALDRYRPVRGRPPRRPRVDDDPTQPELYLRAAGRLAGRL